MNNNTTLQPPTIPDTPLRRLAVTEAGDEPSSQIGFDAHLIGIAAKSIAIPMLLAAAFGLWLDKLLGQDYDWTVACLAVGFVVGSLAARNRVVRELSLTREEELR
jgi:predicted F0F1-ATPase subunit